ncbi:MAG: efflux RND transporter periplasmic adaptor subunit [Rhodobacteraceae bacterium]|nr:efflux RND transporter periplasmic adaptor subunit [Paracoccaceae bacterium]
MRGIILAMAIGVVAGTGAVAQTPFVVEPIEITEFKSVFGRVEARNRVPARSRLGGTLVSLTVEEGDVVKEGAILATVDDEKLRIQLEANNAQTEVIQAQLINARNELTRGQDLLQRGVTTVQRLDALRTQVDVLQGQIEAAQAQARVIVQQAAEGDVLAPMSGIVLRVPVTRGAVVQPGEMIAEIGGGGVFLRLAVPERYAGSLREGAEIIIDREGDSRTGRLDKIFPLIENGRVIADVQVDGLDGLLVDARVLVRLPIGKTKALMVPEKALVTRFGLDYVAIKLGEEDVLRNVVVGHRRQINSEDMIQILSGIKVGDIVAVGHE